MNEFWPKDEVQAAVDLVRDAVAGILSEGRTLPDAEMILPQLRRNKIPLLWFAHCEPLSAPWREAIAADQQRWHQQRAGYAPVHERWAAAGISHVFIKALGPAPSFPYQSDNLDVLIPMEHSQEAQEILRGAGFVELRSVEEPHKYLYRRFSDGAEVCGIHLHEHIGWIVPFINVGPALAHSRLSADDPLVAVLSPEDGLLTTLAHFFYEDKEVKLLDWAKVVHCLRTYELDWDYMYNMAASRGWADGLGASLLFVDHLHRRLTSEPLLPETLSARAWEVQTPGQRNRLARHLEIAKPQLPLRIPFVLSKRYFYAKIFRDPQRDFRRKLWDAVVHTGYGVRMRYKGMDQRAMLVTLSGVDGAGKTSHARVLEQAFGGCHIRTRYVWSRSGSSSLMTAAIRLGKRLRGRDAHRGIPNSDRIAARVHAFRSPWVRHIWAWLTAVDLLGQYTLRTRIPLLMGWVVICDRYVYDALAEWTAYFEDEAVLNSLPARLLLALSPRPAKGYVLDLPPEIASERSADDLPADFMARQRQAYLALAKRYDLCVVDASRERIAVADELTYDVLSHYLNHFRTVLNGLFLKNPRQWMWGTRWPDQGVAP
ncbi:MAG: nucleotidyltransferase family protein [Chloroflexi bacterium]|nr:nucleotidyltransferase family protein [Chloroflexota bacterium]